jgi:hypothetical protein
MDRADARNMAELYKLKLAHETMRVAVCGVMEDIMRNVDDGMPPPNCFFWVPVVPWYVLQLNGELVSSMAAKVNGR